MLFRLLFLLLHNSISVGFRCDIIAIFEDADKVRYICKYTLTTYLGQGH